MSILQEHIGHIEQEQLSAHQSELTTFFLTSLDFRAEHCQVSRGSAVQRSSPRPDSGQFGADCLSSSHQGDLEKAWQVESGVIDCLITMVMKLSEVTFRPLFFKVTLASILRSDWHFLQKQKTTEAVCLSAAALRLD